MERMGWKMNYIPKICEMLGLEWDESKQESRFYNGIVFSTKEEAIAKAKEILEMLKGGK